MHAQLSAEPRLDELPAARPDRVLIIDHDPQMVERLGRGLSRQGFDVLRAASGSEGLHIARGQRPDLIVIDARLPDTDGFTVCQDLADGPATCGIPLILLSGMCRPDIIRRSRAAGCQYYVRKPCDPNALLTLIRHSICEARRFEVVAAD